MSPQEAIKRECEDIIARTGIYVPPYRLSTVLAKAGKVFDVLTKNDVCTSYAECLLTLKVVMNAIKQVTGEDT